MSVLVTKTLKSMKSTLYEKTKGITRNVYYECFYVTIHAKHPLWRKETRFPETCLLSVSESARHKKRLKGWKAPCMGKQTVLPKTSLFSIFELLS